MLFKLSQNLAAQTAAGFVAVLMALSLTFGAFAPATASAASDVDTLCAEAAALGVDVTTGLFATLCAASSDDSSEAATGNGYIYHPNVDRMFNVNLRIGARGEEVRQLQIALNDSDYKVATSGAQEMKNYLLKLETNHQTTSYTQELYECQ